jgi:uncharacterized membrane protein
MQDSNNLGTTKGGMQPNIAGMLCYTPIFFIGLIASLFFFFTEKDNKFVRFHAVQSLCVMVVSLVLLVPLYLIIMPIGVLIALAFFALAVWCMYQAYQGVEWRIPVIGDFAAQNAG